MEWPRQAEFATYSPGMSRSFSSFVMSVTMSGRIGPESSRRLIQAWPETLEESEEDIILSRLAESGNENSLPDEVIAAALRTPDDFSTDEEIIFRLPILGSQWDDGRIGQVTENSVEVEMKNLAELSFPAYYPALFRTWEGTAMKKDKPGHGHVGLARFAVKLSYFDLRVPQTQDNENIIDSSARKFGANPQERLPRQAATT